MSRRSQPWKWLARKGYYAWVGGKRVRLCDLEEGQGVAWDRLRDLQAIAEGRRREPTVRAVVAEHLQNMMRRAKAKEMTGRAYNDAHSRLTRFLAFEVDGVAMGSLRADEIRAHHVYAWLDAHDWNPTTRCDYAQAVRGAFRHAARRGRLERNPLAEMDPPGVKRRRDDIPSADDLERLRAAIRSEPFRTLFDLLALTGARPGEISRLEAKDIDWRAGIATLREHKTARKTRRPRIIYFPAEALEILQPLADLRPVGPLLRNERGTPWNPKAIVSMMARVRERAGVAGAVTYHLRHAFITRALAVLPTAVVGRLAGHANIATTGKYEHLDALHDQLREAANKVGRSDPTR